MKRKREGGGGRNKSPKNGNFRERGKRPLPVTRTYYGQAERCAVCLTSGPAASFVPAPCKDTRVGSCTRVQPRGVAGGGGGWRPPPTLYRFVDDGPRSFDTAFDHTLARHQDLWRFSTTSSPARSFPLAPETCYQFRSAVWIVTTLLAVRTARLGCRIFDRGI